MRLLLILLAIVGVLAIVLAVVLACVLWVLSRIGDAYAHTAELLDRSPLSKRRRNEQ